MMAGIKEIISSCADRMDSFYLYDERRILGTIPYLKNNFPQVDFLYSIKCNPNASILRSVFSQGLGADAAAEHQEQSQELKRVFPEFPVLNIVQELCKNCRFFHPE